jgi:hypothetical protein
MNSSIRTPIIGPWLSPGHDERNLVLKERAPYRWQSVRVVEALLWDSGEPARARVDFVSERVLCCCNARSEITAWLGRRHQ